MPKPTRPDIVRAYNQARPDAGYCIANPYSIDAVLALIDEAWEADQRERERGQTARDILLFYDAPPHKPYCNHRNQLSSYTRCSCGLSDALAAVLDEQPARDETADVEAVMRGVRASAGGSGAEAFALATPEMQAQDRTMWEYAEEEQVEQHNREQRTRREAFAAGVVSSGAPYTDRALRENAAARYPLKKRVPATVEDPHDNQRRWRLSEDGARFEWCDSEFSGEWGNNGRSGIYLGPTPKRVRVLAALLDNPWTWEDSTDVEGEAT